MKDLTSGSPAKLIVTFAVPMLIGNLFQQFYNIVDSIVVGQFIGKEALAAVGASFPVFFLLIAFVIGLTTGAGIIISQYFGAGDLLNVRKTIATTYLFLIVFSLIISAAGLLLTPLLLQLIKVPAGAYHQAVVYLRILFLGTLPLFGYNILSAVLRALGDSKTPLYFLIWSTLLNVILDLLLVVVFRFGVSGAAWATVIAETFALLLGIFYIKVKKEPLVKFDLRFREFSLPIMRSIFNLGMPSAIQQTALAASAMIFVALINKFGTDTIAAFSAASRIDFIAVLPAMNFSVALATFVGQNIGAGKLERIKQGYIATLLISGSIAIFFSLLIIFNRFTLLRIFTTDQRVISLGSEYLLIVASFYLILTAMFSTNGVIRGSGATFSGMAITIFSLIVIRLPAAYWLSIYFGTTGLWLAFPASWLVGFILSLLYYISGRWKKKALVRKIPEEELIFTD